MEVLVTIGVALTLLGIAGLLWCIVIAAQVRKQNLDEETLKARLQKVVALNLAALGVSAIGLMTVIIGLFLN